MRETQSPRTPAHRAPETRTGESLRMYAGWRNGYVTLRDCLREINKIWS